MTTADNDEERIQNVLQPSARMRGFFNACYWSSGPSEDVDSSETLDFRLAHPVCVVHEVHLQPFKAYFQLVGLLAFLHVPALAPCPVADSCGLQMGICLLCTSSLADVQPSLLRAFACKSC